VMNSADSVIISSLPFIISCDGALYQLFVSGQSSCVPYAVK